MDNAETRSVEMAECHYCLLPVPLDEGHEHGLGETICESCYQEHYEECHNCGEMTLRCNMWTVNNGNHICESCYGDDYFTCVQCNEVYHDSYSNGDDSDVCDDCWNTRSQRRNTPINRSYYTGDDFVENNERAYAVEIECLAPTIDALEAVAQSIPKAVGITDDGSVSDSDHYGKEFITPKLSGKKGKAILKTLCSELVKNKFIVNKTCGLHVHIDTSELAMSTTMTKRLFLFYLAFEPVIFSYLPISRRENRFCLPLSEFYHEREIINVDDREYLEALWYRDNSKESRENRKNHKYDQSRYAGINFHSHFSHQNIEIRYHSGTVDYNKIDMWIQLHVHIVNRIVSGKISNEDLARIKYIVDMQEKQKRMFEMLDLPDQVEKYFVDRQKKFGITNSNNKDICAE